MATLIEPPQCNTIQFELIILSSIAGVGHVGIVNYMGEYLAHSKSTDVIGYKGSTLTCVQSKISGSL